MTTRPMLFSGPMVRALLAGTKTQTRRVVKDAMNVSRMVPDHGAKRALTHIIQWWKNEPYTRHWHCPYGQPGDRLWVRETFTLSESAPHSDGKTDPLPLYRADFNAGDDQPFYCKPSIHMPRWASRITLEITGVRVERLQEISEQDARAEGITDGGCLNCGNSEADCGCLNPKPDARDAFINLWESINGAGSWIDNPWVWVLEFKRV